MKDKFALVTGANRGIGKAICSGLIERGTFVFMCGRKSEQLEAARKEINPSSEKSMTIILDVTDEKSINDCFIKVGTHTSHLDILINNAGIISSGNGIEQMSPAEYAEVISTNTTAPLLMINKFIPLLKKSDSGRVINVSSGMGAKSDLSGSYAPYRLSKAFLNIITIMAANELSAYGITVSSVCPGWVKTDMGGSSAPRDVKKGAETILWLASEKNIPTGKFWRDKKEIPF